MSTLKKLLALLTVYERRQAVLLMAMTLIMALLDVVGVASIMPFMAVLANPDVIRSNSYLAYLYQSLGMNEPQEFLFVMGCAVFGAFIFSISFKALTTYAQLRFTLLREYSVGHRLMEGYLRQPYEWFLNHQSTDMVRMVLSELAQVIHGAMIPMMQFIAQGTVALALLILLLWTNPLLSLVVGGVLGVAYSLIYFLMRGYLERIGTERMMANNERFQAVGEAFGGIKDVKVSGLESTFLSRFAGPAGRYAQHQASAAVAALMPRFFMELVAFGGILLVVLYLMRDIGGFQTALPIIGLYVLAGYRLMPALQGAYASLSTLRYASAAIDALHRDLINLSTQTIDSDKSQHMVLKHSIALEKVSYTYPQAAYPALNVLTLRIPVRKIIGLVGATGSGKTTTVDLILGLLSPQHGALTIDEQPITSENVRAWQRVIGYVPQHIYLADDSVAANIAFGVPKEHIDPAAVERASRIANLHQFVISELPEGYDTSVGERGIRLSGGQRQRIGIARALYRNPQVLLLDEATSALDNLTERAVMEAVQTLARDITVILVAHRLSTVRDCDLIYLLDKGTVIEQGNYTELLAQSARFRALAGETTAMALDT